MFCFCWRDLVHIYKKLNQETSVAKQEYSQFDTITPTPHPPEITSSNFLYFLYSLRLLYFLILLLLHLF